MFSPVLEGRCPDCGGEEELQACAGAQEDNVPKAKTGRSKAKKAQKKTLKQSAQTACDDAEPQATAGAERPKHTAALAATL